MCTSARTRVSVGAGAVAGVPVVLRGRLRLALAGGRVVVLLVLGIVVLHCDGLGRLEHPLELHAEREVVMVGGELPEHGVRVGARRHAHGGHTERAELYAALAALLQDLLLELLRVSHSANCDCYVLVISLLVSL